MYRIITQNQVYFVGKVWELLESLDELSNQYSTLQELISDHLDVQ